MSNQIKSVDNNQMNLITMSYQDENHPVWEIRMSDEGFSFNGEEIKDSGEVYEAYKKFFAYANGAMDEKCANEIKTAYEQGRQSVLDEIAEEQKKFLQGFNYKKHE